VGADEREIDRTFKVYHVVGVGESGYVVLKVALPQDRPSLPTLTTVAEGPRWAEMEIRDMLGIEFEGLAPGRLILPEWWRKESHRLTIEDIQTVIETHRPEILIVGTGKFGLMKIPPETRVWLKKVGVELRAEKTTRAVQLYNQLARNQRVVGAFHLTC
jgi:hypothetical protein